MKQPRMLSALFACALFAACSHDHPLAGNWSQETADGSPGMVITFDAAGGRFEVHTAPDKDGHHSHLSGTSTCVDGQVTLQGRLLEDGKANSWTGTLVGGNLELTSTDGKLKFRRGGKAHGH